MNSLVEKNVEVAQLSKQTILIYGRPKIGKSTLANCFPNPLFLATEAGLNNVECDRINVNNWDKFLTACAYIVKGEHNYQTIVIDTYDNLTMYATEQICKEKGIEDIGDYKKFGAYHLVTNLLRLKLNKLASYQYQLVLISHNKLLEIESKTRKYNMYSLAVGGANKDVALNLPDIILFMDSEVREEKEVGVVRCKPSMYWHAGDRSKRLPEEIIFPMDKPQEIYKALEKCFGIKKEG